MGKRRLIWLGFMLGTLVLVPGFQLAACAQGEATAHVADQTSSVPPTFAVAVIKATDPHAEGYKMQPTLNGFTARGATLLQMIQEAYGTYEDGRVLGGPAWLRSQRFDLDARYDGSDVQQPRELTLDQRRSALQALLSESFQLRVHAEQREFPAFDLRQAKDGSKLCPSDPAKAPNLGDIKGFHSLVTISQAGHLQGINFTAGELAKLLQGSAGRVIVDRTGLPDRYDFELHWTPDMSLKAELPEADAQAWPSLFTALRQQLGLQLLPARTTLGVMVVDAAAQPSPN